jgi:hypothetical protein
MTAVAHYCTYFDHRFLSRGLALHASMRRHCGAFRLWVLCLSEECHAVLTALALPDLVPLRLQDLEAHDGALLAAKRDRALIDYYFTCTAALLAWLFATRSEIDVLTYVDADVYFFGSPGFLLEEFRGSSVLIVPHAFSDRNRHLERFGRYNVGWLTFRRDASGLACLAWWRRSCLDWCRDEAGEGRFADQKYLDEFPARFSGVRIVAHPGVDVAPWNLDRYRISLEPDGAPRVDGEPIVFYHFHGLRRLAPFLWKTQTRQFGARLTRLVRRSIYAPYLAALDAAETTIRPLLEVRAPPLERVGARSYRSRLLSTLRVVAALLLRGGGLWVIGKKVL